MKLRLPTFLCAALLACMACATTAHADTFLAEGVNIDDLEGSTRFYDGGKGRDWDDFERAAYNIYTANGNDLSIFGDLAASITVPEYQPRLDCSALYNDSGHCWAYTSANMLQYWQTYYGVFSKKVGEDKPDIVHGSNYDREHLDELGGTQSLKLNKLFYDSFSGTTGGSTNKAFGWYLQGENDWQGQLASAPGYFSQYFDHFNDTHTTVNGQNLSSLSAMSDSIKTAFGYSQQNGEWVQTTKGQIMHLELKSGSSSHAITCYGFETDAEGNITALYVVNSDDGAHQLVKVYTKFEEYGEYDYRLSLHYDEECSGYNTYNAWTVTGWSNLNTPEVLKNMLAEYEKSNMIWMGSQDSWTNTQEADVNVLPTDETGWMAWSGSGTDHAGYYNTYYNGARGVVFNDVATSGTVNVAEDITTTTMAVNNTLAYSFNGGDEQKTITTGSFSKTGSGAVSFENVKLVAGTATLEGDVTFDELEVTGTLSASGKTVHAKSITLGGNATIGAIGGENGENISGTTALTITGGTTKVESDKWTNLKSLTMSGTAGLEVGASLNVADDITSTADMAQGGTANIKTGFCLKVGGDVNLAGNISSGAYIKIGGAANVTGNVTTTKDYIEIGGAADIGGTLNAGSGTITLGEGGRVGGTMTASSATLHDTTTIAAIGGPSGEDATGTMALGITSGSTTISSSSWTNLKSLSMSDTARLSVAASLNVAEDLRSTGDITKGGTSNITTTYCLKVGGKADVAGDINAGAYVKIGGDANISGNLITSGNGDNKSITIGGNANIGGELKSDHGTTIKGNATLGGNATIGGDLAVGGTLTSKEGAGQVSVEATGSMTLGGDVSNVELKAQTLTMGAADGGELTLNSVRMVITGGEATLTNVRVTETCSFSSGVEGQALTLNANGVTFVLEGPTPQAQAFSLFSADPLTETQTASSPLVISSSMLEGLNINGSVTLDLSNWQSEIKSGNYDSVVLDLSNTGISEEQTVQVTLGDEVLAQITPDSGISDGTFSFELPQQPNGGAVPEPATATLSLLALAALAARRRRK